MNKNTCSKLIALFLVLFAASCADPDLGPILTFDTAGKGAYVKLLKETTRSFNFYDLNNASYTYSVEFVDLEKGALLSEYNLDVTFVDKNPGNGDKTKGPVRLKSYKAADLQTLDDGFKGLTDIKITAKDLLAAVGLTTDDVNAGDVFQVVGTMIMQDGSVHTYANSSAAVQGSAFGSHFNFNLALVCPSDLAGDYVATTTGTSTDDCCPAQVTLDNKAVKLTAKGGGVYEISDFSAGLYYDWYDVYGIIESDPTLKGTITDVCNTISGSIDEPFGTKAVITGTAGNGVITYTWENGFGDMATVTLKKK